MIDRIHVCSPIRFTNICRNEVKDVISARRAKTVMEKGQGELYLTASESIQQRTAMVLRNVQHYVIDAHFDMTDAAADGAAGGGEANRQHCLELSVGQLRLSARH